MPWKPYSADEYLDADEIDAFCRSLAEAHPEWVELRELGRSHQGRALLELVISAAEPGPDGSQRRQRPAVWLDAGTHASEWTGVSAVLWIVSRWLEGLVGGDEGLQDWFRRHEAVVLPCISPDGVQAMHEGAPYIRSSLRPPPAGRVRSGLDPCDIDGDGAVRMMRWKHPAGSFVDDPEWAPFMRPRTLDDAPEDAYFLCEEGRFVAWDGVRWVQAPREFGIDLNRNFPASWAPFSMFGMDAGEYPASEPESRAVLDAFAAHPRIGCALTMHTYTGCVLTQPYREDTPLGDADVAMMEVLAEDLVEGTDYQVYRVYPDFMYDKKKPVVGVWADTISTVFGVPGYTVELWDPFGWAGVELERPTDFFRKPDLDKTRRLLRAFAKDEANVQAWREVEHPQLGVVEVGGLEYMRTIRNPPPELLAAECEKAWRMAERARRSLPEVGARVEVEALGAEAWRVRLVLENTGFLPTQTLERGAQVGASPGVAAWVEVGNGQRVEGPARSQLDHLDGWGSLRVGAGKHPVYAGLPGRGHRGVVDWVVRGQGAVRVVWSAGRGGQGIVEAELA